MEEVVLDGHTIRRDAQGITVIEGDMIAAAARIPKADEHDENLALLIPEGQAKLLADRLIEYFETDDESRDDWKELSRKGIALIGVNKVPENDEDLQAAVQSPGEAQVMMPLLSEAMINFQSRAIAEMFPATGPLKVAIVGALKSKELQEQADRVETFGNYYFTVLDKGYFPDTDQMLMTLPADGSVFRKASQNYVTGLPQLRYVRANDFVINYAASSLEDADRYAHNYEVSGLEVKQAQARGLWDDRVTLKPERMVVVNGRRVRDESDGRKPVLHDDDGVYDIIEYHIEMELDFDPKAAVGKGMDQRIEARPYIIIVERTNRQILMIRRNWAEKDPLCRKVIWFAHHKFFPGLGFYGWGYPHLIGSLQKAVNDGVNAALDASYFANFRGGFITEEGKAAGMSGEIRLSPGEYKVLKGSWDEISKAIYSPEFKGSEVSLVNLVGTLIETGRRFASITEAAVGDADNTGPVGTTIALIEQSNVIPTAIHKRLHQSFGDEYGMWEKLTYLHMPDEYPYQIGAEEKKVLRMDFDGRVDVVSVSDPNISSSTQRLAMCQGVLELQGSAPDLYPAHKRVEAHNRMLRAMKISDPESVGPEVETPKYLDPVSENQLLLQGKGVQAFETQDHAAHRLVHQWGRAVLMNSPEFQAWAPERQQAIVSAMDAHDADHMGLEFRRQISSMTGVPLPPPGEELPPELEAELTAALVAKLPPPPPLPQSQGPSEGQAMLDKVRATIQGKKEETEAKIERDTEEWSAEQLRLQQAHEREERRKDEAAQAEIRRQTHKADVQNEITAIGGAQKLDHADKAAGQKLSHGEKATAAKLRQGEAAAGAKLQQGDRAANQKLAHADATTNQKLEHADATTGQKLAHDAAAAEQSLKQNEAAAQQSAKHSDAEHEQAMKHVEEDAALAREQKQTDHKQTVRHKGIEHAQQTRHANEDHDREGRFAEEDHQREAKQSKEKTEQELAASRMKARTTLSQQRESGKLKISQAKEAARAKKAAAAKKKTGTNK